MSLYDTLQKTKQELPYRFQRLQNEANAKRAETVTPNTNQVSREQGIRDSYRQRVEDDRNTALASMGNQGVPTGQTLIEKATSGFGQTEPVPQQKSVRQYLGLEPMEQQEETPKPKSTLELLEQQREENAKKITEGVLPEKQTASFLTWLDSKAGQVNRGVTKTIDVVANAIPMLEGAIMGENPDSTLTGQLLKPLTDATGKLDDWTARETENATKLVDETIGDNQALRLVSDIGGGVITALPTAALAMMTGGASAGGTIGSQLAPQASGLAGTVSAAWQKLISNPMFQTSFIQGLGSGYEEAKEAGASDVNAMAAALLSTTANSIVEVGGGVETLPGELKNADLSTGKKALQWLTSALDEGKEEVVQGAISSMVNKAASGSDMPYFSMTDENAVVNPLRMGQEFGMGTAVGGILGGGQMLANSMLQKAYSNRSGNALDAAIQKIFDDNNKKLNIDNTESQAYNGINENGGALDGRNNQLDGASGEGVRAGRGGSWTDSGSQDGRRFGQDDLSVPGIVLLSPEAQQTLTERGIVNVELHDSSMDNTAFSAALDAARVADSQNGWAVTPKDANELTEAGTRTFLDRNGSAGFAIASDGDIEAVFANKTAGAPKGATKSTIPQAIANGGTKLDCYGHGLVRLYGRYGFIPVARVTFNPEYANPGWTADKGMPDIYFMMHNGDSADTVVQNMGKYKTWSKAELEALPLMEYDEAYKYRDSLMSSGNGSIWKLDAAIKETLKPTQELENLNNAIDGLFAQNKTAQADTGAESTNVNTNPDSMPKVTMADFTDRLSAVFNNLEYGDTKTQTEITQKTHQDMVSSGEVVKIPESTLEQTESYYPDLRGMKKQERAPILKQKITELKTVLRKFLNGMKGGTYEFEVNGNILEAKLYDTGVREVMDKITQNKASMLLHSEEVFKNARYLYSTPDYEGDPNIYRWNYFYTPVDIGGETVGVRIAVRDIALGQNNIPESQIYNWNIKKDAALGGEKLGTNAASPDTSSAASDNNSIRGNSENVNGKSNMEQAVDALFTGMEGDVGDMGAKTSDFEHKVKESQTAQNTIGKNEARWNVPEDQRVNQQYDAVTEQESLNNARMRIEQDLPGEQEALRRAAVWSNEEVDMGMLILGGLRQKAKEMGDWTAYKDWAEVVKQHGVASGQGLQAWAKYTRRTGDGIMQTVAGLLESPKNGTDVNDVLETVSHYADRFDDAVAAKNVSDLVSIIQDAAVTRKTKRSWGKKLGGEIDWALKRIADYADAEVRAAMNQEGDGSLQNYEFLRDFAAASIEDIAGDHVKTSIGKMALTVRRMSMLSKAATIMRNLVGNGAFDLVDTLARNISVLLDMLLSKVTGKRSVAFDSGALSKTGMKGQLDGLAKALLEVGLDVNAGGASSKYENSANRTFKMSGNVVSKLFSTWEKYMGYALNVTDEMKKGSVDARVQQGLDKLYEQGKIKDDSLRTGGQQEALYRTFQDKTRLSDMSLKGRNALNVWNVGDAGLGDVLIPFAQVPANLADRAIDYSPAGLVESTVNLSKVLLKAKKGTLTAAEQAQAVQNLGRNITGSALIAIAAGLASNGFIRVVNPGGEDENKDKAAFEKMQGQSGTQFNVSAFLRSQNGGSADWQDGDTLVSIAFLEPFNAHLTIGALLAEDMKEEGQLTANTIAKDTFTGSLTAILDLPMFEKFRDVSDAYTYSTKERSGEKLLDAVNTLAANEVGSLIPNSVKGIAQGLDPYQRDLYSRDDAWGQAADQFRAVFDRDSLPIKQDSFGWDMMNEGGFLNFLNSNILPGQITTYKTDELLDKITDLSALTGKASVYPSRKAPDKITVDGEDVPLNQEQQRQYQSTYGQTEYETRSALIGNSLYDNLTPQEEIKAHSYAEDYAKQVAKSDINADFEPDSWVEALKGKTPAEVADAIMLKTFQSMAEDKKNYDSKYDGITDMLDSGTIDEAMAVSMLPEQASSGYYKYIKGSGIELSAFIDVYQFKKNAKSDKDKDGKTTKSAQEKVIEYINKVGRGPGQKRRMFLAMGYSEKSLPEEWK